MQETQLGPPPAAMLLGYLFIWFLIGLAVSIVLFFIARRKGKHPALALIGFLPLVSMLFAIWLASLTDHAVLKRLEELGGSGPKRV